MKRTMVRAAFLAVALAGAATLVSPAPSYANPPAGPNQSVTFTYYSNSSKTVEVGWYSYGSCGESYDIGTHTPYYRYRTVTCLAR